MIKLYKIIKQWIQKNENRQNRYICTKEHLISVYLLWGKTNILWAIIEEMIHEPKEVQDASVSWNMASNYGYWLMFHMSCSNTQTLKMAQFLFCFQVPHSHKDSQHFISMVSSIAFNNKVTKTDIFLQEILLLLIINQAVTHRSHK